MRQKIYSILIIIVSIFCIFIYMNIFSSSLRYERNKSDFNAVYIKKTSQIPLDFSRVSHQKSFFLDKYLNNPMDVELYLRAELINTNNDSDLSKKKIINLYHILLESRPSWPYLYSGLAQVYEFDGADNAKNIGLAMLYGRHELKIIKSMAEILFYNWDRLNLSLKSKLLNYLSDQHEYQLAAVVNISAKFIRVFEYCDYIYEKKHVEYAACKSQFWQPLSD